MGMMAKMRSLAPAFIITVGALFVLFMVISDSNVLEALGGRSNDVGSVNGISISYPDFQAAMERQRENTKQQTGEDIPEEQWDQFRDQVWDALITQTLLMQEIERLGITVSNQEVADVILGEDPPPFLKQNFIDSLGNFNRAMYEEAIFNPENEQILLQAEEYVRQTWLNEKLQNYLLASITVGENEILRKFKDQNIFANSLYALFDLSLFPDTLFKVSEDELSNYYNDNKEDYKQNATRKIKFVIVRNQPSLDDSNLVRKNLESVKEIISADTSEFKSFVEIYSENPYSLDTLKISELSPETVKAIRNAQPGDVFGPFPSPEGFTLYHFVKSIQLPDKLLNASHILINDKGDDTKNLLEANRIYQELINGADFKAMAIEFSKDPGSGKNGGELGWFGKGMMVKEFEEACFKAPLNVVQKPVKTSFGYHIIKVTEQSDKSYVVERIINAVKQSAVTRDETYNAANDFSYLAEQNGFEKEAELMKYNIQESTPFAETSPSIAGIGANPQLIKFAFENGLNDISDVHKASAGFVVAKITEVNPEGYRPLDELKIELEQKILTEKRFESAKNHATELIKKINGDINKINTFDPRITINSSGKFNTQTSIPNVGRDNAFIRTALSMQPNQLSEPVKGLRGYYVIYVTEITPFDSSQYNLQSNTIKNSILQEKKNSLLGVWMNELKEKAEIVDNRHLFYGY